MQINKLDNVEVCLTDGHKYAAKDSHPIYGKNSIPATGRRAQNSRVSTNPTAHIRRITKK